MVLALRVQESHPVMRPKMIQMEVNHVVIY